MASIPRNAPCPCGSGLKYKKCCLERETELDAAAEALEELLSLASLYPLLRPLHPRFEAWITEVDADPTQELVEVGLALIGRRERRRIVRGAEALLGPLADEERQVVLVGSVVAALRERRELDPDALAHLENCEDCRGEPAVALAAVLEPCDLWSIGEAEQAEQALEVYLRRRSTTRSSPPPSPCRPKQCGARRTPGGSSCWSAASGLSCRWAIARSRLARWPMRAPRSSGRTACACGWRAFCWRTRSAQRGCCA